MRPKVFIAVITALTTFSTYGQPLPSRTTRPTTATTKPASPDIPTLYADYQSPAPLTGDQTRFLLDQAAQTLPEGRQVWFIYVARNGGGKLFAHIFYTPDTSSPRLRRMRCAHVWSDQREPTVREYVQVLRAPALESAPLEVPTVPDLPFRVDVQQDGKPVPLTDQDIVALFDLARPVLDNWKRARGEPVRHIRFVRGLFEIQTGWFYDMLAGSGHIFRAKRTPNGFEQEGTISMWRA